MQKLENGLLKRFSFIIITLKGINKIKKIVFDNIPGGKFEHRIKNLQIIIHTENKIWMALQFHTTPSITI